MAPMEVSCCGGGEREFCLVGASEQAVPSSITREQGVLKDMGDKSIENLESSPIYQVCPMFEEGTLVEYFSATHKAWLPGQIALRLLPTTDIRQPTVVYNIRIKSGGGRVQVRKNIPPSAFRLPLEVGEPAEIVSKDWCKWTPCVIEDPQGTSRALGYSIRLATGASQSKVFKKVPQVRLRRRFADGAKVRVFQGSKGGWVQGEVDPNVVEEEEQNPDFDFMGAPVLGANISKASCVTVMPNDVKGNVPGMTEDPFDGNLAHSTSLLNEGEGLLVDSLWRPVPVRILDAKEARIFPGYLVYPTEPFAARADAVSVKAMK